MEDSVSDRPDSTWNRALMASSGIAVGHHGGVTHRTPEQREAGDAATPLARLQSLAMNGDDAVRATVAGRPNCPLGLLASLAHDRRTDVRVAVAGNSRITDAIAHHLAGDRDPRVLKALARNASVAPDIVEGLALHRKSDVRRVASREIDARWGQFDTPVAAGPITGGMPTELHDRVVPRGTPSVTPTTAQAARAESRPTTFRTRVR
jgi:hypothetical protein